ncbi:MAG: DUF2752 domain-containing protein [Nitriliruptorales bacterium]|nr:DUF2752 domain-containing protein [Nitriliruptorales bacterium]
MAAGRAVLARPLLAPAAAAAAGGSALAWVANVSPHEAGHYPSCAFLALTGLQCPGCGTLRAMHELGHGDLLAALDLNALTTVLLLLAGVAWLTWVRTRLGMRSGPSPWLMNAFTATAIALPIFGVLRNLEPFTFLAP